jgi:hypothetical protein
MMYLATHPSIFQIAFVVMAAIVGFPSVRILHRVGLSGWWALILLIPGGGFVALWLLAFANWPALEQRSN